MQTKQQIERLLASAGLSPNKRLGQHFLIDLNLMRLLIDTAAILKNDIVLEVGCGTGSFTQALALEAGRVIAVEYDASLIKIAKAQLAKAQNVQFINTDVLENKNTICHDVTTAIQTAQGQFNGTVSLIANLPYNVAASVMANLIIGPTICDSMYITVQKEVAERMQAPPGSKNYGTLSILMAASGQVKLIRKLGTTVFGPCPQVESAMVSFHRQNKKIEQIHDFLLFREVVNLFMNHRRKMLKACVKFAESRLEKVHNWADIFSGAFIDPHLRGEQLTPEDYISIANLCNEQLQQ